MPALLDYILEHEASFRRARLRSLYSDFRQLRHTNPDGYNANISAWQTALSNAVSQGLCPAAGGENDLLILRTSDQLLQALETKELGRPLSLGTVAAEGVANKHLVTLKDFSSSTRSIFASSWVALPWQLISWGFRQVGLGGASDDRLSKERLVIVANVQEAARNIIARVPRSNNPVDRIFSREAFERTFARALNSSQDLTTSDFSVLLRFLERDLKAIACDGEVIKFLLPGDKSPTITTQDTTIASLKILIADLAAQTEVLATRVESCAQEARAAVEKKNPVKAKICLRSKKLAEVNLTRRSDTLVQLEEVYSKIVQAADQVEIVRVMESSTAVMKDLHAQIGGADQVDEIVHNLREQMEATEEIGGLIGEASQVDAVVDEAEVENELKNLLKEQEQQSAEAESIQTQERVSSLPKVPGTVEVEQAPTRPERKEDTEVEDSAAQLGRISLEEENLPAG